MAKSELPLEDPGDQPPIPQQDELLENWYPGNHKAIEELRTCIKQWAKPPKNQIIKSIFIKGPIGSGKTFFAGVFAAYAEAVVSEEEIRKSRGFVLKEYQSNYVTKSLGAISKDEVVSAIFGYEPGHFTGAKAKGHPSIFEHTNSQKDINHVFFDEIGHCPLDVQPKFLQLFNDRTYTQLGGVKEEETNAVILTATNADLDELVASGKFMPDLLSRLGVSIKIPSLKEQIGGDDGIFNTILGNIVRNKQAAFLGIGQVDEKSKEQLDLEIDQRQTKGFGNKPLPNIESKDLKWATSYDWPFNFRQLILSLDDYYAYHPRMSFRACVLARGQDKPSIDGLKKAGVVKQLNSCLEGKFQFKGSVADFIKHYYTLEALEAIVEWVEDHSKEEVEAVFEQTYESVMQYAANKRYGVKKQGKEALRRGKKTKN